MSRQRYLGVTDPQRVFEGYRGMRRELAALRLRCTPFGADYKALAALIAQLDATASHFTGEGDFYGGRAPDHTTP